MRFRLQSSKREIKMLNRLLKTKIGYSYSIESFNFLVKTINESIPGEKFHIVQNENEAMASMNKMAASLNGRKILKINLKYTSNVNEIESNFKWNVKVLNSSTRK